MAKPTHPKLHALHYLNNAEAVGLSVGGLDWSNIGAADVGGNSVFWGDLGFRWKLSPNMSLGASYGFPISNPSNSIFNQRLTVDVILRF